MALEKVTFNESLQKNVILAGKCLGCGACAVACPFGCVGYAEEKPCLAGNCRACGICASVCPQFHWSLPKLESFAYGRKRRKDEEFGVCRQIVMAKATNERVKTLSQDGGAVTALLQHALKARFIDGVIVSGIGKKKPFYPVPKLATTPEMVLESAGTRYSYSPNILALSKAIEKKRRKIAFVGTPCQVTALRRMQMCKLKLVTNVKLLIGLMCSECFSYEGLMERHLHRNLGIKLQDVKSMNIKGKMFVYLKSKSLKIVPLSEAKQHSREKCAFCGDFSAELSDISAGGLGLQGCTLVVIRSKEGEDLLKSAVETGVVKTRAVEEKDPALKLLLRLSNTKQARRSE